MTTKNEVPLAGVNRIFHKVTTTDDPIIRKVCLNPMTIGFQDNVNFISLVLCTICIIEICLFIASLA